MTVFKCKMCGGNIIAEEGMTYGTCDSCGSVMTLPKVADERIANLFNRANHFRRLNDFDRAIKMYDNILNEDSKNAEAHWGMVLSKYGIEYVEDPKTHERIPTCHRVQRESILSDINYLEAIENAPDGYSRSLYEKEAERIRGIQRGILAITNKEEPYDVFICYKEQSEAGTRTKDSVIGQEIYYRLKREGMKVFFSRITLEDKLGKEYEPYIFGAINTAKVMVVIGTKSEYFNAVWVKNEWKRYLELTKRDKKKIIIPCYREMDAYDLPEELSLLQSLDMSKIGFIQDLARGIKKIIEETEKEKAKENQEGVTYANSYEPLLKRVSICLEDGEYEKADELSEQVLNINPECAKAYIGKLMVELKISKEEELTTAEKPLSEYRNYIRAIKYADEEYKNILERYNKLVLEKIEQLPLEKVYQNGLKMKDEAYQNDIDQQKETYEKAIKLFESIREYKDSDKLINECKKKIEQIPMEEIYTRALNMIDEVSIYTSDKRENEYKRAIELLKTIIGYKDTNEKLKYYTKKIVEIEEEKVKFREKNKKRSKVISLVCLSFVVIVFIIILFNL